MFNAKVLVSILGKCKQEEVIQKLNGVAPYLQYLVSQENHLRRTPKFYFVVDNSLIRAAEIDQLISETKKA